MKIKKIPCRCLCSAHTAAVKVDSFSRDVSRRHHFPHFVPRDIIMKRFRVGSVLCFICRIEYSSNWNIRKSFLSDILSFRQSKIFKSSSSIEIRFSQYCTILYLTVITLSSHYHHTIIINHQSCQASFA